MIGVIISILNFAWKNAKRIRARKYVDLDGVKHYEICGPFFGSVGTFAEKFDINHDLAQVIIDFKESRMVDHSTIEALNKITERYARAGKKVSLKHLSEDCYELLSKASSLIEVNYRQDPQYKLASDKQD